VLWWVSTREPAEALRRPRQRLSQINSNQPLSNPGPTIGEIMERAPPGMPAFPDDVLLVEDDPIIALDFEDTILGLGVKTVRTAASVAKALQMIADRAPDFALLDVGLVHEKSFAIAERLDALNIPFVFVTGYAAGVGVPSVFSDRPLLPKPCSTDALEAELKRPVGAAKGAQQADERLSSVGRLDQC
jgi:CheY-like chemotaxis protein